MSIRLKLIILFTLTVCSLCIIGVYAVGVYQTFLDRQKELTVEHHLRFDLAYSADSVYRFQLNSWKNLLLRGDNPDAYHKYLQQYYHYERRSRSKFSALQLELQEDKTLAPLAEKLKQAHAELGKAIRKALRLFNNSEINAIQISDKYVAGIEEKPRLIITKMITQMELNQETQLSNLARERKESEGVLVGVSFIVVLASLGLGLLLINRNIVQPAERAEYLASVISDAEEIAKFGTWDWDLAQQNHYWSAGLYRILNLDPRYQGSYSQFVSLLHQDDRVRVHDLIELAIRTEQHFETEARVASMEEPRVIEIRGKVIRRGKKGGQRLTCNIYDITRYKASEERLKFLANYDSLTKLPNRLLFQDRLGQALAHARRNNTRLALLYLDLDKFKAVNDVMGHHVGDQLLIKTASRIRAALRQSDTAARLGGDEFTVIIENYSLQNQLVRLIENIIQELAKPYNLENQEVIVSVSVGIAIFPDDGRDVDTLLRNADAAMYLAKEKGRNTYYFFTWELNKQASERLRLENQLRKAMQRQQFRLYYQPKIDLASGRVVGAEALLRWFPDQEMITPDSFISILEETGMIKEVGSWVLREACNTALNWRQSLAADFCISVNISVRQLMEVGVAEQFQATVAATGLPAAAIELEITESMLIDETIRNDSLKVLEASGMQLAIDDFGTGYSNLSYLKELAVDTVKINRSFIQGIGTGSNSYAIISAIVALSHQLGIKVIAEGVESPDQKAFLRSIRCDQAQGFYYAKPMPQGEFESWYRDYCQNTPVNKS